MYNVSAVLFHDEQATYFDDGHKSHLSVVDALGDKRVVLMKNHGAIVVRLASSTRPSRRSRSSTARAYHLDCVAAGGTEILEDEVVAGKAMYRKHFLPQMWDANLARLRSPTPTCSAPSA